MMALSNEDRQKLAEIERELTRVDPALARSIAAVRFPMLRPTLFGMAFLAAAGVLIGGLVTTHAFPITGIVIAVAGTAALAWSAGQLQREVRAMLPVTAPTDGEPHRP